MYRKRILLVILASLPIGLVAVWSITRSLGDFLDPCLQWAVNSDSGTTMSLPPPAADRGPCATRISGSSETRQAAIVRVLLVPVAILAGVTAGIFGAIRARYRLLACAAILLLVEAFVAFSVAPLAFLAGFVFLWAAIKPLPADVAV